MTYIPKGADQQGRRETGVWTAPHRTHEQPEAAHAASEHTEPDDWLTVNELKTRAANRIAAVLSAVAVLAAVVLVALGGWK